VTYIAVDCTVGSKKRISSTRQIQLSGGGGTDMGIGIQAAIDTKPRVDVCIVLTDGDTPWPAVPPPFKTIVVLTSGERKVPAWTKAIVVN
jgi:predicted metal-dependent peptidase